MILPDHVPVAAPAAVWGLWLGVVALATLAALVVTWLRRWLLRPMPHKPSDLTDAWTEAGRRFRTPDEPADDEGPPTAGNGDDE